MPIPRRALILSQKRFELFCVIVPDALPTNKSEPVDRVVVALSGGLTVQLVAPGAHDGSSVSPGKYGEVGGEANAVNIKDEAKKRHTARVETSKKTFLGFPRVARKKYLLRNFMKSEICEMPIITSTPFYFDRERAPYNYSGNAFKTKLKLGIRRYGLLLLRTSIIFC